MKILGMFGHSDVSLKFIAALSEVECQVITELCWRVLVGLQVSAD